MNVTRPPRELQELASQDRVPVAERKRQFKMAPRNQGRDQKERDPMKALKMQRRLASVSYGKRSRVKADLEERDSFDDFGLLESVRTSISSQALRGMQDISPTPIQRLAIPALLENEGPRRGRKSAATVLPDRKEPRSFLLAAETGSGKTLAYLLPLIDALKRAEEADAVAEAEAARAAAARAARRGPRSYEVDPPDADEPHSTTARPRVIVLLPTSELVAQVGALAKSISHTVKFRSALISAAYSGTVIRNRLFSTGGIDLVIATPHLISSITESDPNILARCTHLVIDEADSLLDRSFSPITQGIIDRATPSLEKLIFCSATIPRSLDTYLQKRYPDTQRLATPNLHAIPRRVQLSVIDIDKIPYQGNRDLACAQTILDIGKESEETSDKGTKIIVFVNEREKSLELAEFLQVRGIDAIALNRDSDQRKQSEVLAAFTGIDPPPLKAADKAKHDESSETVQDTLTSRRLSNTTVLVTTDITSRGIDTFPVKNVILYDVPHTSIDFIHRLGRVGRMGRRGRGVVLVGKHDRKDIVKEVREGMFRGAALV